MRRGNRNVRIGKKIFIIMNMVSLSYKLASLDQNNAKFWNKSVLSKHSRIILFAFENAVGTVALCILDGNIYAYI